MGKAISRWIISLLLGKKEEKDKKISIEALPSSLSCNNNHIAATSTPKVKRRWSFGKSSRKDSTNSKLLLRLNSDHHNGFVRSTLQIENDPYQNDDQIRPSTSRDIENAAAVKIQSVFRSYLAKKALCALRGIVKVQALARGHLVRKRTASTLHSMHALMTIQLRARLLRLHNHQPHLIPINPHTTKESLENVKSRNGYSNQSRVERKITGSLSFSEEERVLQFSQEGPINYGTASKIYPARASYSFERPHHLVPTPTYMAGTESSKAKTVRSASEPKQRPNKGSTNQKVTSKNETDAQSQLSSSHSLHFPRDRVVDPWFFKFYGSPSKDRDYECDSQISNSNFYPSFDAYELPVTLY